METTSVTSNGRLTIPLSIRQQLGIRKGDKVMFSLADDHIEMRVTNSPPSGFGMLSSSKNAVPVDFNAALMEPSRKK